jgi:hypothetical protein
MSSMSNQIEMPLSLAAQGRGKVQGRLMAWLLDPRRLQLIVDLVVCVAAFLGYQMMRESIIPG